MEITEIPFAQTLGLQQSDSGLLELAFAEGVKNHVQTIAAAAQFSLAELASGEHLQKTFPELVGEVIPVLRGSKVKFKNPAQSRITAFPSISEKSIAKFREQYQKKGRALIDIDVAVKDIEGTVTALVNFTWYLMKT